MALSASVTGHGVFFYVAGETIRKYGSVANVVSFMRDCRMQHAWVRIHGRTDGFGSDGKTQELVNGLRDGGIHVAGWGWCQGEGISAEAELALRELDRLGLKDYIADIEHGHNASNWTRDEIVKFLERVRAGMQAGSSLLVSTFALIDWHEPELMKAAEPLVDAFAPQIYWFRHPSQKMRRLFGDQYPANDSVGYTNLCLDRWRALTNKPLVITGQAYWGQEGDTVFEQDEAERKLNKVTTEFSRWRELAGFNWWHAGGSQAMSYTMRQSIMAARIDEKLSGQS